MSSLNESTLAIDSIDSGETDETDNARIEHAEHEMLRLSQLVEASDYAINGTSLDGIITSWNAGAEKLYGYRTEEIIGRHVSVLSSPNVSGPDVVRERMEAAETSEDLEVQACHKNGSVITVSLTLSLVRDVNGEPTGFVAVARDITDRIHLRAALELERDRLVQAQEMAHVGCIDIDLVSGDRWCSDEYRRIHGVVETELFSREDWLAVLHPEDRERLDDLTARIRVDGKPVDSVYRITRADGEVTWAQVRVTAQSDTTGRPVKLLGTTMDITARRHAEEALKRLVFEDPLTGLANRALLKERIDAAVPNAELHGLQVGVLFLDLDRLKVINDGMGHAAGDELLVQLAARLRQTVRPEDVLARFAGDEFVIVCDDITERGARRLAQRIGEAVQAPFLLFDKEVRVTMSIGLALSQPGDTAESLLHDADAAMYRSKLIGRGEAVLFDQVMHRKTLERVNIESQLPGAVERGELRMHYQPILDMANGRPVGFEALIRWERPGHGLVPPDQFIPRAEETGLIIPIGEWALNQALREAQHWRTTIVGAEDFRIAVNLSAKQLQDPRLFERVEAAIAAAGIDATALELEITESVLMEDVARSMETLTLLRNIGVGISIDDFGTGYSSLSYLKRLPVTTLKIDRSFVEGLGCDDDEHARPIVQAVISLARALGLDTVAEGVETPQQLAQLQHLEARLGQGFHWSKPLTADNIQPWLEQHVATG